ncbi:MAG: phosphate ABC transporter permease PstA [Methanosarcinales archaeon]
MAFFILKLSSVIVLIILALLLYFIFSNGISAINWEFLTEMPSAYMTEGGIYPAIIGTLYLVIVSMMVALPLGVLSAIYLTEYAKKGKTTKIINLAINNLAGTPSIVFGLFGLALFVNYFGFGPSILAASLTLALVVLPVIIRASEEALLTVPQEYREASLAIGATKWQTIQRVVLPAAIPGIITGTILSIGRVAGETAPILFTGAAYYLPRLPDSIYDQFMALPYHLFVMATSGTNIAKTRPLQYGTAFVLLVIVLSVNLIAVIIRKHYRKKLYKGKV